MDWIVFSKIFANFWMVENGEGTVGVVVVVVVVIVIVIVVGIGCCTWDWGK